MPKSEERVKQLLDEPLDSILTIRVGVSTRVALREIAAYYGTSEQDIVRRLAALLASTFQDAKSQAALGASYEELLGRSTRFTLVQFMSMSPADLRRMADEFSRAAHALASVVEKQQNEEKPKGSG